MPVLPNHWSPTTPVQKEALIHQVLSPLGLSQGVDDEADRTALDAINSVIDDLNTRLWEFNKRVETGGVMTTSTAYISVPDAAYKINLVYLVETADSTNHRTLQYLDWNDYVRSTAEVNTDDGEPCAYAHRSVPKEGRLYLWPRPDATTASDYTVTYEYYRRIPHADEEDPLQITRETQNAIVYKARSMVLLDHGKTDLADRYQNLAASALSDAINGDRLEADESKAFRLIDTKPQPGWHLKWHLHV